MNINYFKQLLAVQTVSGNDKAMKAFIMEFIISQPSLSAYEHDGNIYITKGIATSYPCIVAHTDTVHKLTSNLTPVQVGDNITGFNKYTMQQTGIGGDDKNGIFVALHALENFPGPIKIAFFRDEETGCNGSYNADLKFFNNVAYVLQCDRKGTSDLINNASGVQLCSKRFIKAIRPLMNLYNYKTTHGYMTDVMALKELGIPVSMCNISCGYFNPHTAGEYINIPALQNCINFVMGILSELGGNLYEHTYTMPATKKYTSSKAYFNNNEYWNNYKLSEKEELTHFQCDSCLAIVHHKRIQFDRNYDAWLCDSCVSMEEELYK